MNGVDEVTNVPSRNKQIDGQSLSGYGKGYMVCKLIQRGSLVMILVALSGDVESNPGFVNLNDVKTTCGLKIAHLNIRSLRYKSDSKRLEGLDIKTNSTRHWKMSKVHCSNLKCVFCVYWENSCRQNNIYKDLH